MPSVDCTRCLPEWHPASRPCAEMVGAVRPRAGGALDGVPFARGAGWHAGCHRALRMAPVWFHPEGDALPGSGDGGTTPAGNAPGRMGPGHRLNLLLSYAGWSPDPWVERIPTLLEPMGVVSHRVGSGRQAEELIKRRSIHIAVVDMGLPLDADVADDQAPEFAEGGARLLELLARLDEPPPVVAVTRPRAHRDVTREINAALRLGAFAVVSRPREPGELDVMLDVLRKVLQRHWQGRWPEGSGGA